MDLAMPKPRADEVSSTLQTILKNDEAYTIHQPGGEKTNEAAHEQKA